MRVILITVLSVMSFPFAAVSQADDDLSTANAKRDQDRFMAQRVDQLLEAAWDEADIYPALPADDSEFVRRVYLDLAGRIPHVAEVRAFLNGTNSEKRLQLVDQLLASTAHHSHLAAVWRETALPQASNPQFARFNIQFEAWLRARMEENMPYDEVVRQLLLAEGQVNQAPEVYYYSALELAPEKLATNVSRFFLGIQIGCAECHDHPFDSWEQEEFWGMAAFFAQVAPPEGATQRNAFVVNDRPNGEVSLPGEDEPIIPRFPGGEESPDIDSSTRRQRLADWITAPDNRYFARATVNRLWAHLLGRGLVHPVDDLGLHNPSVHPQLLDELADYFVASDYDLRRMIRLITLTRVYQLSSCVADEDQGMPVLFERIAIKPMTAAQLYDSITVAARRPGSTGSRDINLGRFGRDVSRQQFLQQFSAPPENRLDYQSGIPQALHMLNGTLTGQAVDPSGNGLVIALTAPFFTDEQRIDTLFLATLSRPPDETERLRCLKHLASADNEAGQADALGNILWALLNTTEFVMNH